MDQTQQADKIAMRGALRDRAVKKCAEQLSEWHIAVPNVDPLVLDFGLGEFERTGLIEFWIANEEKAGYCGKYLFLFDGQSCPMHSHRLKHETFFVVQGNIILTVDGQRHALSPGDVFRIPPDHVHGFSASDGAALVLEVSTPCWPDDNNFVEAAAQRWLISSLHD